MAEFDKCFRKAAETAARGGQPLTPEAISTLQDAFNNRVINGRRSGLSLAEAIEDAKKNSNPVTRTAMQQQYNAALNIVAIKNLHDAIQEGQYRGHSGPVETILRKMFLRRDDKSGTIGVEGRIAGIDAVNHISIDKAVDAVGSKNLGFVEDRARQKLLEQAMEGHDTGDAALNKSGKELADRFEALRTELNRLGGNIKKVAATYIPTSHDVDKVFKATMQKWVEFVDPLLDKTRYKSEDGALLSEAERKELLQHAWLTIVSEGQNKPQGLSRRVGGVAAKFTSERVLHFTRDGEAWTKYNDAFGSDSLLQAVDGKMKDMARQIALAHEFGPSWQSNINTVLNITRKQLEQNPGPESVAQLKLMSRDTNKFGGLKQAMDYMAGGKKGLPPKLAQMYMDLQGMLIGSAALIKAPVDAVTTFLTARHYGMSGFAPFINGMRGMDRVELQNAGLFGQLVGAHSQELFRQVSGGSVLSRMGAQIQRLAMMNAITRTLRTGYNISMSNMLGHMSEGGWEGLANEDKAKLANLGITATDFALWKAAPKQDMGHGEKLLTANSIAQIPDQAIADANAPAIEQANEFVRSKQAELQASIDARSAKASERVQGIRKSEGGLSDRLNRFITKTQAAVSKAVGKANDALFRSTMEAVQKKFGETTDKLTAMQQKVQDYEDSVKEALAAKDNAAFRKGAAKVRQKYQALSELFQIVQGPDTVTSEQHDAALGKYQSQLASFPAMEDQQSRQILAEQGANAAQASDKLSGNKVSGDKVRDLIDKFNQFEDQKARDVLARMGEAEGKGEAQVDKATQQKYAELRGKLAEHWNNYLDWWEGQKAAINQTQERMEQIRQLHEDRLQQAYAVTRNDLMTKLLGILHSESYSAVVTPGMRMKSAITPHSSSGGVNFLINAATQFSRLPAQVTLSHFVERGQNGRNIGYVAQFALGMALAGALRNTAASLLDGKEPPPLFDYSNPEKLAGAWGQAFIHSGALSMLGDWLNSDGTFAVGGPILKQLAELGGGIKKVLTETTQGEGDKAAQQVATQVAATVGQYIPGSTLWWLRGMFKHAVMQNVNEKINPGYQQRIADRAQQTDQPYWWKPGTVNPFEGATQ